jgi:RimJ/RimL family protein N-acetyltransferase
MMLTDHVVVSGIEPEDLPLIVEWLNRPDIYDTGFGDHEPMTLRAEERFLENAAIGNDRKVWLVSARDEAENPPYSKRLRPTADAIPIGMVGIKGINWRSRYCEMAPFFIGDLRYRNFQLASETELLVLRYCFDHLGMNKVWGSVLTSNSAVADFHKLMGWTEDGTMRQHVFKNGRFQDAALISILRNEFHKRYGEPNSRGPRS